MKMPRIFYAADGKPNSSLFESRIWYINLYMTLVAMGCDVVAFDYDMASLFHRLDESDPRDMEFIKINRPKLEQALMRQLIKAHEEKPIDIFYSYFYSAFATQETIKRISSMGITTMNYFCNASYQFDLIKNLAPAYDYSLVAEKYRLDDYASVGANPVYCQMAANPRVYRQYDLPVEYDVVFVGAKYGDRPEYIRHLSDEGVNVNVWGPGWNRNEERSAEVPKSEDEISAVKKLEIKAKRLLWKAKRKLGGETKTVAPERAVFEVPDEITGSPLSDEEMVMMYSRCKISLGFSQTGNYAHSGDIVRQVRLRDFEAPACGAFYMVEYMEELEEFFDIGREIVCYTDKYDLAEKVKYYLAHDDEREKIRLAGHRRTLQDHTWEKRFEMVFKVAGFA